jgi:tetratricopeptide (TPR) repeat protein/tRNA A-37 threonylcarbamoyl transferase component Bud32
MNWSGTRTQDSCDDGCDATDVSAAEPGHESTDVGAIELRPPVRGPGDVAGKLRKARVFASLLGKSFEPIKIDRFTLLEPIGAGGMGEIYAAYDERLDRRVAIKLVRSDLETSVRADDRLLREAQTLARLSHPNVVQVYESGIFRGRVFIAMEFIRGGTLQKWLASRRAPASEARQREVLRMVLAAGRGLEAAHRAGLIHRDFKPENVLVGDEGRPRVVDFGLARLQLDALHQDHSLSVDSPDTDADSSPGQITTRDSVSRFKAAVPFTRPGQIVGTPRYMSPEQMRGEPADSRSDQFSFCVTLYEALYQELPFAGDTLDALKNSMQKGRIAEPARGANVPAPIRKALLRGLSIDPADRFPDMGALLSALEQWPAQGRQRWLLGLASAALIAGGTGMYLAAIPDDPDPCARATERIDALWSPEQRAALAEAFARTDLPYAKASWAYVEQQLDSYATAWKRQSVDACEATQVRHVQSESLMDRRMFCLERGSRHLAALLDEFAQADAAAVERAASATAELPSVDLCGHTESLLSSVDPPAPGQAATVAAIRDRLAEARTRMLLGRDDALRTARDQLALAEGLDYPPVHAEALFHTGYILVRRDDAGEIAEGERLLEQASNMAESERHDTVVAEARNALVLSAHRNHPDRERGYRWSERALAAVGRLGDPPGLRAVALQNLGALYFKDNKFTESEEHMRRALALLEGDAHVSAIVRAQNLHFLARTLRYLGKHDEARALCERALALLGSAVGDQHPRVLELGFELAVLHLVRGELEAARATLETVLANHRQGMGEGHVLTGKAHLELAEIHRRRGDLERAREHAAQGLAIYERVHGPDHLKLADTQVRLGAIEYRAGRSAEALAAYQRALAIQSRHRPPTDFDIGFTHANIAEAMVALGRPGEALASLELAETILAPHFAAMPEIEAALLGLRGQALLYKGERRQAVAALEAAVRRFDALPGDAMAMERADAYWALARALGRPSERTRALARDALAIYRSQGDAVAAPRDAVARWLRASNDH